MTIDDSNNNLVSVWCDYYTAEVGETITLSYYLNSEYHNFVCFTVDGEDIEGDSFVMPNKDVEVGARLQAKEYTISYVLNGGVNSPDNPTVYTYDDDVLEIYDATKEGYEFVAWYYDEDFEYEVGYVYKDGQYVIGIYGGDDVKNLTLYAKFEPNNRY